jgi:threonine/homoserine/homoserine lactone efflux protein
MRDLTSVRGLSALLFTSFFVGLSGALMPGPLVTAAIAGVAREGFWVGPGMVVGHAVTEAAFVIALAAGLGRALNRPWVSGVMGLAGGLFLLWMGWDIVQGAWSGSLSLSLAQTGGAAPPAWGSVVTGVALSLANPYLILWWATIGASYVALGLRQGPAGLAAVYTGHTLSDAGWITLISFLVASGRAFLSDTLYRGILLACGLFLLALGVYFVRSGLGFLREQAGGPPAPGRV